MKARYAFAILGVLAFVVSVLVAEAVAASPTAVGTVDRNVALHLGRHEFGGGATIGPLAQCDWDFPALGNTALDTPCSETANCNLPGAAIGDSCIAGTNLGVDGGAVLLSTATISCRATTNAIVFKLCVSLTDAGSYNLTDAGLFGRVIR